jgi:RNA polymerase sigma-70 factor (ECF subfamily)
MVQSPSRTAGLAPAHAPVADACANDAALIAAARADPAQFALIYERYVGPVYRYCYFQLGQQSAAEDVTSEVFMKALAGIQGFRGGAVPAWLLTIARHAVIDHRRRRRPAAPVALMDELPARDPTPEGAAIDTARTAALREALAALPKEQRTAVELGIAGWSGDQIGAALGKSRGAVYLLRARALARMGRFLRRSGWSPEESGDE